MGIKIVEPVSMRVRLVNKARAIARKTYHASGRHHFKKRLARFSGPIRDKVRLNFGWIDEPSRKEETVIGGGVKLGHLRKRFGEKYEGFNILYLVSSVLHLIPHVEELVSWAKSHRVMIVWNQNGVAYPAWCGEAYPWFNEPMQRLMQVADHIVYQSEFCRQCADRYLGVVQTSYEILWNPVDTTRFFPAETPPAANVWRLLAMGTNHSFYRVKSSLDVLKALIGRGASVHLTIAGEFRWDRGLYEVREYIERLKLSDYVYLSSRFTQEEANSFYQQAHVLLHPKYKDPCPTVPIEAMACGVPVIGSCSGGMPELVSDVAGRLIEVPDDWMRDHAPDPEAIANAVVEIMNQHAKFSCAARARAEMYFDCKKWLDRHEEIFSTQLKRTI